MYSIASALVLLIATLAAPLSAQEPEQFNLVALHGAGRIVVTSEPHWDLDTFILTDHGTRPEISFKDHQKDAGLTFTIFGGGSGNSETCRSSIVDKTLENLKAFAQIQGLQAGISNAPGKPTLALESFFLVYTGPRPVNQQNLYAFYASADNCAEMHVTKNAFTPADAPLFTAELARYSFDAAYQPVWQDYAALGNILYQSQRNYAAAVPFYERALDALPTNVAYTNDRRMLTDQLSMSLAVAGEYLRAYSVNELALQKDPNYAYYYYNLACIDGEMENPIDARRHLESAFANRSNTLPGEPLPNPANDESFQKLKRDKKFWKFVESLNPGAK